MNNTDKIQQLLGELNELTLKDFVDNLEWKDIKHYRVKQPSGTPIYRHFVTIPQYYLKGSKNRKYLSKPVYGGKIEDVNLNDINYRTYVINKIKSLIKNSLLGYGLTKPHSLQSPNNL